MCVRVCVCVRVKLVEICRKNDFFLLFFQIKKSFSTKNAEPVSERRTEHGACVERSGRRPRSKQAEVRRRSERKGEAFEEKNKY